MKCEACGGKGWVFGAPVEGLYPLKPREQFKCPNNCEMSQIIDKGRKALGNPERRTYVVQSR